MLDLWQRDTAVTAPPQPEEGRDLPATFADTFSAAWSEGQLFSDSTAQANAQRAALDGYLGDVHQASGEDISKQVYGDADPLAATRAIVAKMKAENPGLMTVPDLTDNELDRRAALLSGQALANYQRRAAGEKTFGGRLGMMLGGIAATVADPVNLVAGFVAPEAELGVLGTALMWGAAAGTAQAVNEATNAGFREQVEPGYGTSGAAPANIVEAGLGGAVLGGALKGLGAAWTRLKTGAWPTSVRDAGNVVESEANIQRSNVLPGIQGETAHREALSTAIDQVTNAAPVDVSRTVNPEIEAGADAALASIRDAIAATKSGEPGDNLIIAVQQIARGQTVQDVLSSEQAESVARALTKAEPDQVDALLRQLQESPQQTAANIEQAVTPPRANMLASLVDSGNAEIALRGDRNSEMLRTIAGPEHDVALRADIDRARALGDVQIPVDVDKDGNAVMRGVDAAMNEVDAYKTAAEQIQACAAPQPEPGEAMQ